ncbi:YWFCY domain-containing protein [Spirosoma agri]|uniref:TraM recognition domain-containing protein n=1 Tax=Spirosoma agri TaxID=1987381 RepID=A0A6M0IQN3_9BACT|nr:YWFCY domain-containing protein [Spirosoma agri]NEU70619.1 TraM recognition domain-containing protein [Spirosoma agri]
MRDDRKQLNQGSEIVLWFGLAALAFHLYIELHTFWSSFNLAHPISDGMLDKLTRNSPKLVNHYWVKLFGGFCIGYYSFANRGVKSVTMTLKGVLTDLVLGLLLYIGSIPMLSSEWLLEKTGVFGLSLSYLVLTVAGVLYIIKGAQGLNRLINYKPGEDEMNEENETFLQEERLLENPYSVNLPTQYTYKGKIRRGWLNITAPFRAMLVMGIAGSGKSYGIVNSVIRQHLAKGFSMYVYDYKFPTLSLVTFNAMIRHKKNLAKNTKFYCISFEFHQKSHRCNPLHPSYLPTRESAGQTALAIMLNLNKKWIDKEGEFFVESPISYVTVLIWFLRNYQGGKYCTVPHLVELVNKGHRKLFPILASYEDLEVNMAPFISAYEGGAMDQLEGQMASSQIGFARLSSPNLYWVMSGNDFMLDINNPKEPKILCLGNDPKVDKVYGAALGLYNFRILELINQQKQHQTSVVIDELPTIYCPGLSNLINTGRSNRVAVTIAMQDFAQLEDKYGRTQAEVIKNTCGNIISGQVYDKTAEAMQNRLGKNVQQKQSINIQSEDTTHGISTELNYMAPAAKIGRLSQGEVVGVLADNKGQESRNKAFNALVLIDDKDFQSEQKVEELPNFSTFAQQSLEERILENYKQIKADINELVESELARLEKEVKKAPKKPKTGDE